MTIENWVLSVIPSLLLLLLAWFARRQLGSWLAPSAFFGLYWGGGLLIPLILEPDLDFWPGAAWLILFLGYTFHLGVLVGAARNRFMRKAYREEDESVTYELRWGKQVLILSTLCGFVGGYILISKMGFSLPVVLSHPVMVVAIGRQYAGLRYAFGESIPVIVRILNTFLYLGLLLTGVWLTTQTSGRSRAFAMLPIIAGLLQVFLVNARTGFAYMVIFVISGFMATVVLNRWHVNFLNIGRVSQTILVIALFVILSVSIQMIREGRSFQDARVPLLKVYAGALSGPIVFSHWLEKEWTDMQPAWGVRTFVGFFDFLGLAERKQGLGWEGQILEVGGSEFSPNEYTAFRPLIEDFTLPGAMIVLVGLGVFIGKAYREVLRRRISWLPVLALFYAVTLGSYLANLLNYNSCLFGWLLFFLSLSDIGPRLLRRTSSVPSPVSIVQRPVKHGSSLEKNR